MPEPLLFVVSVPAGVPGLIEANSRYHQAFDAANLLPPPRRQLAVLTCMDCRIDTASVFGLDPGDAHVLRNAGARASDDAIRSLVVSTVKLEVRRIAVVHHTHCGAAAITQDLLVDEVLATTGSDAHAIDFLLFDDLEQAPATTCCASRRAPTCRPGRWSPGSCTTCPPASSARPPRSSPHPTPP
jgi:carbonic anhydrase